LTGFLLAILLAASEALYLMLLRLDAVNGARPVIIFLALLGAEFALCFVAYLAVRNKPTGAPLWALIAGGAVLFRITLLPAGLPPGLSSREKFAAMRSDWRGESVTYERFQLFDDDIWRYLWDGHVAARGANPYTSAPADPSMDQWLSTQSRPQPDWESIRGNINYPRIPTIYPPLAQMVFRASHWLAPGSVLAMKATVVGFDLLACVFLILTLAALHEAPAKSILYAWNPLVIKVFAGSGHIDAIAVAALAAVCYFLARRKRAAASVGLGLAIAAKVFPVILLPFLARRVGAWRTVLAGATALACCGPYLGAGTHLFDGLHVFSATWQFNAGPFQLLTWAIGIFTALPQLWARTTCAVLIAATVAMLYRYDDGGANTFARYAVLALGAVLIFGPVVMPWYTTWLLPLGIIAWNRAAIFFSMAVCTAFLVMVRGVEWPCALVVEYGTLAAIMWWERSRKRARPLASEVAAAS
jgi:hypothetical protein